MNIVLGSSSPRRKWLLQNLLGPVTAVHPDIDEIPSDNESPLQFAQRASRDKLNAIIKKVSFNPSLIITCDTIVTIDNTILGKPADYNHAYAMLTQLSGRTHQVISAISMVYKNKDNEISSIDYEISDVTFKKLLDNHINSYLSKIHYLDKAGAYAVQEFPEMIIQNIEGSITNVIGFPLRCFYRMIADMDIVDKLF